MTQIIMTDCVLLMHVNQQTTTCAGNEPPKTSPLLYYQKLDCFLSLLTTQVVDSCNFVSLVLLEIYSSKRFSSLKISKFF